MNRIDLWRVYVLLIVYAVLFTSEFLINQLTHSVLVLVDAYHNLFIFTTLILLLVNHKVSMFHSISLITFKATNKRPLSIKTDKQHPIHSQHFRLGPHFYSWSSHYAMFLRRSSLRSAG